MYRIIYTKSHHYQKPRVIRTQSIVFVVECLCMCVCVGWSVLCYRSYWTNSLSLFIMEDNALVHAANHCLNTCISSEPSAFGSSVLLCCTFLVNANLCFCNYMLLRDFTICEYYTFWYYCGCKYTAVFLRLLKSLCCVFMPFHFKLHSYSTNKYLYNYFTMLY